MAELEGHGAGTARGFDARSIQTSPRAGHAVSAGAKTGESEAPLERELEGELEWMAGGLLGANSCSECRKSGMSWQRVKVHNRNRTGERTTLGAVAAMASCQPLVTGQRLELPNERC